LTVFQVEVKYFFKSKIINHEKNFPNNRVCFSFKPDIPGCWFFIVSQSFEMQQESWIEVEPDKPYIIDADKVLVFGVEWEDIPQGFYAAGLDGQSDHPGKGDLAITGTYPWYLVVSSPNWYLRPLE